MKILAAVLVVALIGVGVFLAFRQDPDYSDAPDKFDAVRLTEDGLVPVTVTASDKPYLVIYHTASWCQPSERFSPMLADFCKSADKSKFQLVIKNYDFTEDQMIKELKKYDMNCAVIPFMAPLDWGTPPTEIGIPNLVIVDTKTRKVIDQRYHQGLFGLRNVGPDVPLETLRKIVGK
jgi:thiol-disulfide isomerase/thioredoxin